MNRIYTTTTGEEIDLDADDVDEFEVSCDAASKRVGSAHAEQLRNGGTSCWCPTCDEVGPDSDPEWHPEQHFGEKVACYLCREPALAANAHPHQRQWIGDECCWNERLRSSE
jgi:hypothetical protein